MSIVENLAKRLEAAKGDLRAESAIAAEFFLSAKPESERESLRAALDAVAVLRWFDAALIGKVLSIPADMARQNFEALAAMPFIERFESHAGNLRNLHESTRLGWRRRLAEASPERFRALSARAAECYANDSTSTGRIEWIYHLLCGDPDRGATELENFDREWSSRIHPEERYALAAALTELENLQLLWGRARVWVLLVVAWADHARGNVAKLADAANYVLGLARSVSDERAEADAQCLLGDVQVTQGKLTEASATFAEFLHASRRLVERDYNNVGRQRELAIAYGRQGNVLLKQGKLTEAHAAFEECLNIGHWLAAQTPKTPTGSMNLPWLKPEGVSPCWR